MDHFGRRERRRPLVRRPSAQRGWRSLRDLVTSGIGWSALGLAFLAVAALGLVGFTRYHQAVGTSAPLTTRIYLSIQLLVLESGSVSGWVPWQLEVARFAAPLVAAYTIVQTLAAVFRAQVEALRLLFVHDHVIVAGLGRKGWLLTQHLLRRGERVVVVDADAGNPELDSARVLGALVVVGDAQQRTTLQRAGVARASQLVSVCGADATNVEVVAAGRAEVRRGRSGRLRCVAHMVDPELALLLSTAELGRYDETSAQLELVNVHGAGARALLRTHPPFDDHDATSGVAVVGAGTTAREVALALARAWAERDPRPHRRLALTLAGPDPAWVSSLEDRHPELARFTEIRHDTMGPDGAGLDLVVDQEPAMIYVCPDNDARATTAVLELRRRCLGRAVRVVAVVEQRSGLERLFRAVPATDGGPSVTGFGLLDEACAADALMVGTIELLAQALHRTYLASTPPARPDDPARRPWEELPETLRASNRDQAAHVAMKLRAVGRVIGPLVDWEAARQPFSAAEVEVMGRLEHDRWVAERRRAGWRPGPRDPARRTTPYLVPWEALTDEIRDYDRSFVSQLPRLLASVGLQTFPRSTPGSRSGPTALERPPAAGGRWS
jgi:voltage-gated potassium channel Kch